MTDKERTSPKFKIGDRVRKISGSSWHGHVCGTYATGLTPEGYVVKSEREVNSVQAYPAAALEGLPVGDQTLAGWRSIETAPADGRKILVWGPCLIVPDIRDADGEWWRYCFKEDGESWITHWMPLPDPPRQEE